jgi:hypothetical protein
MDRMVGVMDAVVVMKNGWDWIEEVEVPWSSMGEKEVTLEPHLPPEVVKRACPHDSSDRPGLSMTNCSTVNRQHIPG